MRVSSSFVEISRARLVLDPPNTLAPSDPFLCLYITQSLGALTCQRLRTSTIDSLFTISDDMTMFVRDQDCVVREEIVRLAYLIAEERSKTNRINKQILFNFEKSFLSKKKKEKWYPSKDRQFG